MRLRLMLALMLVGVLACFTQSAAGSVPVPNGDMEKGQDGPEGWTWAAGDGGKGEFAWETGIAHSGRRSFRVKKIGSVGYTILSSDFVPVQEGKTYQISAWIYPVQPVQGGVYFMISQYPKDSNTWDLPNTFGSTTETFVAGQWQQVKVSVTIREGNSRIKIHCVQGLSWPSEVYWDDFEVTEVGEIPQARYEPPAPEPLPSFEQIKEAWSIVAKRPRSTAKVEVRNGRPQLMIDGKPTPWAFYVSPFWNPQDAQITDFRNAGVRVYLVPLVLGNQVYGNRGPWKGRNLYDFSEVDELLWRVLRVDPEGYILFYLACDPYREWGAENPDHVTQDQNGKKAIVQMHPKRWGDDPVPPERFGPSPVSLKLRAEVAAALRELVKYVESSEPGKAVIGYHIGGFNDGQWFHWASFDEKDPHLADYCPGAQESFREWLKRRYGGDVTALRKAWNQPQVTFECAEVPPFERYWAEGNLLDPATQQDIADYTAFYSEGVAETVMYLADVIKEASPRPVICGTYYEDISGNVPNHIALSRYLASSSLDYLAGPAAYGIRMAGYQGAVRSVFGSTLLHGKVFLTEQDWRSWLSYPGTPENNFAHGRAENAEVHNAMVRRECGMMLAFGLGTWWYDMGGGWFRDDQIMAGIAEAMRAFNRDLDIGGLPRADLAVFVSEESDHYVAPRSGGRFRYYGIVSQIHELNKAGVPYRLYLQSDLGRIELPEHRAYLFLNPYKLSPQEKEAIKALKRDGKLLIFVHAPGVIGAEDPAAEIEGIIGFHVRRANTVKRFATEGLDSDHPLLHGLGGFVNMLPGIDGPVYEVADDSATPLAHYVGTKAVAVAAKDFGSWKSVFVGCPGLTAGFLHNLAAWAGCWCAAEPGDAVYANEHFMTIHAIFPGHKVLQLAKPSRVTDLTTGEVISFQTSMLELDMKRGETRWFFLEPH